jgi:hypothetical protein
MANEKLKQNAEKIDSSSRGFGSMLSQLDTSTKKFRSNRGSIIKSAKGNIFEFPVFISNSIPLDYATATSSLLEQVYASYLQMAISINPVIDHTQAVNGLQFSGLRTDTNKYLEYTDTMWQHDACHAVYDNDECVVEFNMLSYSDADAKVILEDVNYQPLEEFSHYFTEDAKDDIIDNQKKVIQAERKATGKVKKELAEKQKALDEERKRRFPHTKRARDAEAAKKELERDLRASQSDVNRLTNEKTKNEREINRLENNNASLQKRIDDLTSERAKAKDERDKAKDEREKEKHEKELTKLDQEIEKNKDTLEKNKLDIKKLKQDIESNDRKAHADFEEKALRQGDLANSARVKAPKVLSEKDMEKLNTMKPILMTVDLNVKSDTGTLSPVEYVVGVKTYNRLIDADIIPEVAEYPLKEMDRITRKAKWRAGELKFFSDIVFRIKEKKQTAVDAKDPKRKWYRRLYELAHMKGDAQTANIVNGGSVIASFLFDKQGKTKSVHGLVPNVSIVVSKSDVDICKMKTGIDLLNGRVAAKLCRELFLMSFVVIDVDAESIKVLLPELHNEYDVHSIASVNRQIASLDSSNKSLKAFQSLMAGR